MRRALSVGGNGRKDAADDDERVFDEKTTRSRGDGSGVEEHALEGNGAGEKSSSSPKRNRGPKKIVRKP